MEKILKHGLKKDYVIREENLHSKIRGKIMIQKHLQKNIFNGRADKIYCCFQEYTADILENRILKKALLFSKNYINRMESFSYHNSLYEIKEKILKYESAFCEVSDEVEIQKIKTFRQNKIFKNYGECLKLAKMIFQRFDYSLSNTEENSAKVPPCVIIYPKLQQIETENENDEENQDKIKKFKENSDINDLLADENKIPGFKEFYKISVELPQRKAEF